jgi:hypothetical protein
MLNGRLQSPDARLLLCSSRLVGVPKHKDDSLRPIAIASPFLRLASQYAVELIRPHLFGIFKGLQYGVKAEGGAARAALLVRLLLEEGSDTRMLAMDAINAFNSISRAHCLTKLFEQKSLAPIFKLVHTIYKDDTLLLARPADKSDPVVVWGHTGVNQGCVFAPLLYALAIHETLICVSRTEPTKIVAYADDVTPLADHQTLDRVRAFLTEQGAPVGQMYHEDTKIVNPLRESKENHSVHGLLGDGICAFNASLAVFASEKVDVMIGNLACLKNKFLSPALAMQFLAYASSLPDYLSSLLPPEAMKAPLATFDKAVSELVDHITSEGGFPHPAKESDRFSISLLSGTMPGDTALINDAKSHGIGLLQSSLAGPCLFLHNAARIVTCDGDRSDRENFRYSSFLRDSVPAAYRCLSDVLQIPTRNLVRSHGLSTTADGNLEFDSWHARVRRDAGKVIPKPALTSKINFKSVSLRHAYVGPARRLWFRWHQRTLWKESVASQSEPIASDYPFPTPESLSQFFKATDCIGASPPHKPYAAPFLRCNGASRFEALKSIHLRVGYTMRIGRSLSGAIPYGALLCYLADDVVSKVRSKPSLLHWAQGACPFCRESMRGGYHAFTCALIRKSVTQKKHDHIVEAISQLLSFAGVSTVTKEASHISLGQHKVDLLASGPVGTPLQSVAIEVSTLLSTAPSALSRSPEVSIEQRVRNKRNKYFNEVKFGAPRSLFVIVFDAFGKHSVDTSNFLQTLKSVADCNARCSTFDMARAGMLLAAANVIGNTMLLLEAARLFVTARATGALHPSSIPYKAPARFSRMFYQAREQVLLEERLRYRASPIPLALPRPPTPAPQLQTSVVQARSSHALPHHIPYRGSPSVRLPQQASRHVDYYIPSDSGSTTLSVDRSRVSRRIRQGRSRRFCERFLRRTRKSAREIGSSHPEESRQVSWVEGRNVHPSRLQQIQFELR